MAKKTPFETAQTALETGTAADCEAAIQALRDLEQSEQSEANLIRPPGERIIGGDGRTFGTLPTGDTYAEAAAAGKSTAELEARYHAIEARLQQAAVLADQLEHRRRQLAEQEAHAAAPARAQELVEQIDALADEHAAAMAAFQEAHDRLRGAVSELMECRKLNRESPGLSIEQFARAGTALAHTLPRRHVETETHGHSHPPYDITPLFGNQQVAVRNAKALVDVPEGLVARIGKLLGRRSSMAVDHDPNTSDREVRDRLGEWYAKVTELLAKGELAAARKLGPPTYKRGNPVFDEDAA